MFYCQACAKKNNWPRDEFVPRSRGPCEVCSKVASCYDVPSSCLPVPKPEDRLTPAERREIVATVKSLLRRVIRLRREHPELANLELQGVPDWAVTELPRED